MTERRDSSMEQRIRFVVVLAVIALAACHPESAQPSNPVQPVALGETSASIQEIMEAIIDPAADRVWESVGSTLTVKGEDKRQPRTDEEWRDVRNALITIREATHLLAMPGRRIVPSGQKMTDEGSDGVLTAKEAQEKVDAQFAAFAQMAGGLRDVTTRLLKATDEKNFEALFDLGGEMDELCESCHMTFWYPGQPVYQPVKK